MMTMKLDEGYFFGMGVFETIAIEQGIPLFLDEHLSRLEVGLENLKIENTHASTADLKKAILEKCTTLSSGRYGLKLCVSGKNVMISCRENHYHESDYRNGFTTTFSNVLRNETSPLTYLKSLNYGDNILEKRQAVENGFSEPLFLNTKGELAEGAVSNVFLIKQGQLYTPDTPCGLLPGILRNEILQRYPVIETVISQTSITDYDEMFLTNSLMGIMPVKSLEKHTFSSMNYGRKLAQDYFLRHHIPFHIDSLK